MKKNTIFIFSFFTFSLHGMDTQSPKIIVTKPNSGISEISMHSEAPRFEIKRRRGSISDVRQEPKQVFNILSSEVSPRDRFILQQHLNKK